MLDEGTGLQNNLNRWYDGKVGRWLSEDPLGFEAGDTNVYRYVGNTTTTSVDPDGIADRCLRSCERRPVMRWALSRTAITQVSMACVGSGLPKRRVRQIGRGNCASQVQAFNTHR